MELSSRGMLTTGPVMELSSRGMLTIFQVKKHRVFGLGRLLGRWLFLDPGIWLRCPAL